MSEQLVLPGAVSTTALELPVDLSFEKWEEVGETLGRIGRAHQWWIGDWLNYGERAYGEKYAQAIEVTEYDEQSLMNMVWVAGRIETSLRRETLSWSHHKDVAKLEPVEQAHWLEQAVVNDWSVRELRNEIKAANKPKAPSLPRGTFDLLLADPPWKYDFAETDSRQIENQYPTMELEEIEALKLPKIADAAVLFMWATNPKLQEAFAVLKAWHFDYKTAAVWVKDRIGMGYHFRQRHEQLLVATRGDWEPPPPPARPDSVIAAPRGEHSAKPEAVYGLLEGMYPGSSKVELFARSSRDGWASWGNEA